MGSFFIGLLIGAVGGFVGAYFLLKFVKSDKVINQ